MSLSWKNFILLLEDSSTQGDFRILSLDQKRKNKHATHNTLENLLETFAYAECQEPRDKIYGLLGLAHDCEDGSLEADYSKPLFEVHYDVVSYFNHRSSFSNGHPSATDRAFRIVRFSELVEHHLRRVIYPPISSTPSTNKFTSTIVRAIGSICGEILHIRPTYREMISSSTANKRWRSSFPMHYSSPEDIRRLRTANETYVKWLVESTTTRELDKLRTIDPTKMFSKAIPADIRFGEDGEYELEVALLNFGRRIEDKVIFKSIQIINPPVEGNFVPLHSEQSGPVNWESRASPPAIAPRQGCRRYVLIRYRCQNRQVSIRINTY
jgi:hypothetical protein